MKVCLLSKFGESSNLLYEGTRIGLENLGINYIEINIPKERHEESPHWISIPTLVGNQPKKEDKKIIDKIGSFKPDILLLLQYSGLPFLIDNGEKIREILGNKGKIGFWLVDLTEEIVENSYLGKYIDYFFLSNGGQLPEYKSKWNLSHTYFMPQGAFTSNNFSSAKSTHKIGFLGRRQREDSRYNQRNALLDAFVEKFGLYEPEEITDMKAVMDFYRDCKIVLGSSWQNNVELYSSDRIFNVLGAGGFYLCSYFPKIERLFEDKKHLVWFETIDEGLRLAKYYLAKDDERIGIAKLGYELIKQKHMYQKRVENVIHIMTGASNDFEGFL